MPQDMMTCMQKVQKIVTRNGKALLTDEEIVDAFNRYEKVWSEFEDRGLTDNIEGRVARVLANDAVKRKVSAALKRKALAQRIKTEAINFGTMRSLRAQGFTYRKAIMAMIEGAQEGVEGVRASAYARREAFDARYTGRLFARIQKEKPHILKMMRDQKFDDDVLTEWYELRKGGEPGKTGNSDAQWLARELSIFSEMARYDANKRGANIGHLDGYAGQQMHDDLAVAQAGREQWVKDITPLLDLERTFPEIKNAAEIEGILNEIHTNIVTTVGRQKPAPHDLPGQRTSPTNLASKLGRSRVLHFKDAEATKIYRDKYGSGSTIANFFMRQRMMARSVAAMDVFGANPESSIKRLVDGAKAALRNEWKAAEGNAKKQAAIKKEIDGLDRGFESAIDEMTGWASMPVSGNHWYQSATLHNNVRTTLAMAKLGGAVITAIPSDTVTAAASAMFRGQSFWGGIFRHLKGVFDSLSDAEAKELSYLLGEGADGLTGHLSAAVLAEDAAVGTPSRWAESFFRWSLLTPWTDASRMAAVRTVSAQLGYHVGKTFSELPERLRHVLSLHKIGDEEWAAISKTEAFEMKGRKYITAEAVRHLDDDAIAPIVQDKIDALWEKYDPPSKKTKEGRANAEAKFEKARERVIEDARDDLELRLQGYFSDETSYGIVQTDAASRRFTTMGHRPGTLAGEAMRYIMQFKGFPIAFSQRVLGRAIVGGAGKNKWDRALKNSGHIGTLIAGMTTAGYLSLAMKDFLRGYWPPRDPFAGDTLEEQVKSARDVLIASMVQGGGMGIYGDFLFSKFNRYGHDPLITLMGPGVGLASDAVKIAGSVRDMDPKAAQMLNFVMDTTPYVNLFYLRPVLDVLLVNDLREAVNPGYIERKKSIRKKEYNQESTLPQTREELWQLFN